MNYYQNNLQQQFNYYDLVNAYESANLEGQIEALHSILNEIQYNMYKNASLAGAPEDANQMVRRKDAYCEMLEIIKSSFTNDVRQMQEHLATIFDMAFMELTQALDSDEDNENQAS